MQSLESKQTLLRCEVLEAGLDAQQFIEYLSKIKGEGENVDLENWTIKQLRGAIALFKEDINISKISVMSSRLSLRDNTKKSKIFDLNRKEIVVYENTNLRDFEVYDQIQCQKSQYLFKMPQNDQPRVTIQKVQIKSVGGFIFGIGARNELQVTISTNFTSNKITRKGEDVNWLKDMLAINFPGWYAPPLQPQRELNSDDKKGINARRNQIQAFLNKVIRFPIYQTSQLVKLFFQQYNQKKFTQFKNRQAFFGLQRDVEGVSTPSGKITIEISDKLNKSLKYSSKICEQMNGLYNQFTVCVAKIMGEMERLEKHNKNLNQITTKLSQKYNQTQKMLKIDIKMPTIFLSFNNISANVSKNLRRHLRALNELNENYVKQTSKDWNEFVNNDIKVQKQMRRYLSDKQNLLRKKERYINDLTRWQLPQTEYLKLKNKDLSKMTRDQKFNTMFPGENENEARCRIWLAHVNRNYFESFRIFLMHQEKTLISQYLQYSGEATCLNRELINNFEQFNQMIFA